jgi:tRNA G46 methylase TrmB
MSLAKPRRSIFADKLASHADFASGDEAAFARRGRWHDFFRGRLGDAFVGRTIVEIGCSDAASLASMAVKHPHIGFIGIDWKAKQIFLGAERVATLGLQNVALLRARAQDMPLIFTEAEVDELLIFHPEPFDRPEEIANRLIAEPFLQVAGAVLADAGIVAVKTDDVGYYQSMLALFGIEPPDWHALAQTTRLRAADLVDPADLPPPSEALRRLYEVAAFSSDFWHDDALLAHTASRCFAGEVTLFEQRFVRKRQPIFYLELRRRQR